MSNETRIDLDVLIDVPGMRPVRPSGYCPGFHLFRVTDPTTGEAHRIEADSLMHARDIATYASTAPVFSRAIADRLTVELIGANPRAQAWQAARDQDRAAVAAALGWAQEITR